MRSLTVLVAVAASILSADAAFADGSIKCGGAPQASWKPIEEATAAATAAGYKVSKIKVDDDCYEAYATDKDGKSVEVFVDPVSLKIAGVKEKK